MQNDVRAARLSHVVLLVFIPDLPMKDADFGKSEKGLENLKCRDCAFFQFSPLWQQNVCIILAYPVDPDISACAKVALIKPF